MKTEFRAMACGNSRSRCRAGDEQFSAAVEPATMVSECHESLNTLTVPFPLHQKPLLKTWIEFPCVQALVMVRWRTSGCN